MAERFAVDAWYEAISSHDPERVRAFLAPTCRYEDVPTGTVSEGVEAVLGFFDAVWAAIPDMRMNATRTVGHGDELAVEWIASGTHSGDFPGLPASGNAFNVRGVAVIELAGNRARRVSDYWDLASSGLLSPPAPSS
jgi:steroid delta-isomerase-like uncharacterized protein